MCVCVRACVRACMCVVITVNPKDLLINLNSVGNHMLQVYWNYHVKIVYHKKPLQQLLGKRCEKQQNQERRYF